MKRNGREDRPSLCRTGTRDTAKVKEPHVKVGSMVSRRDGKHGGHIQEVTAETPALFL